MYLVIPLLLGGGMAVALLREVLIAHFYGTSLDVEIFRVAYALPNFVSFTVATAFTSAAVPFIIRHREKGLEEDAVFTLNILAVLSVLLVTILGISTGSLQANIFAPGFGEEGLEKLSWHIRVTWIMFFFIGLSFTMRSLLQVRGVVWPGASNNLIKAGVYVLVFSMGLVFGGVNFNLAWLTALAVASGLVILGVHFIACSLHGINVWKIRKIMPRYVIKGVVIALASTVAFQLLNIAPVFLDRRYASELEQGVLAALDYSYAIVIALGALLGTSFNMIVLPKVASLFESKALKVKYRKISIVAIGILGSTVFLSVVIGLFSEPIVRFLFMRGAFSESDVQVTSDILSWQAFGIVFMVAGTMATQLLVIFSAFRKLLIVGIVKVLLKIVSLLVLIPMYGVAGFGLSFFFIEGLTFIMLLLLIFVRLKGERS